MPRLIIRNIGPVKEVDIQLNKVNVLIGPQSSGKSTIAKIVSFCSWLEKAATKEDIIFSRGKEAFRRLQSYHHIETYFSEHSVLFYCGENVSYAYNWPEEEPMPETFPEKAVDRLGEKELFVHASTKQVSPKVIYIPAERNFVSVVPNLHKYAEANDSLMDFVQSWYEARRKYSITNKLDLLHLGLCYYSHEGMTDWLELPDSTSPVPLRVASSGLQSIVPLLTLIDWLSEGIYKEDKPFSYDEREKIGRIIDEMDKHLHPEEVVQLRERLAAFIKGTIYTHTQFIIEEPEQNLFPTTQCELTYHLMKAINHGRKHQLLLTTHSPYILYAMNNCMLLGCVKDRMDKELQQSLGCKDAWISPDSVNVWQVADGRLISIKEPVTGTIGKHYFNEVMNNVLDDSYSMMPFVERKL